MNLLAAITAFLQAATAALKVFPLWLTWRVSADIDKLNDRIIKHEAGNTATDRRLADELRVELSHYRRLYGALLATVPADQGGNKSGNA